MSLVYKVIRSTLKMCSFSGRVKNRMKSTDPDSIVAMSYEQIKNN